MRRLRRAAERRVHAALGTRRGGELRLRDLGPAGAAALAATHPGLLAAAAASRLRRWAVLPGDEVVHAVRDVHGTVVRVDAHAVRIELGGAGGPRWTEVWPRSLEGWDRAP